MMAREALLVEEDERERERARDIWGRRGEFKFRKPQSSSSSSFEFLEQ